MCDSHEADSVVLRDAWPRARRERRCYACREAIRVGDRYHVLALCGDGGLAATSHCARCWGLIKAIVDAGADTVQLDLACGVSWQEAFGEDPPAAVAALAFATADEMQVRLMESRTQEGGA